MREKNVVIVVMTCYNRESITEKCICSLTEGNPEVDFRFVVVDDGSTDGTRMRLNALPYDITILEGDGKLFWNGGMHKGFDWVLNNISSANSNTYVAMINDDVLFYEHSIEWLVDISNRNDDCVCVGTVEDSNGNLSYGGVRFTSRHFVKYITLPPEDCRDCDTFNGNCVLIPLRVFKSIGNIDGYYTHIFGDFDYGLAMKRAGVKLLHSTDYVGRCDTNSRSGTWEDNTLDRITRFRKKESPKGLPAGDWFYFVRKNFGLFPALYHSVTPYIKILLKK